jgi:hypothetical protein
LLASLEDGKWFDNMGFHVFETPYAFSDGWDRKEIMVTFLVPKDLPSNCEAPVMWFSHGEGFVSICTSNAVQVR